VYQLTVGRLALAVLVIVVLPHTHRDDPSAFYTLNYLSFFTNESNLLAATLFLYGAFSARERQPDPHLRRMASCVVAS
jgi:hypothetical protein